MRRCPVNALEPMRWLGFTEEQLLLAFVVFFLTKDLLGPHFGMPMGFMAAWLLKLSTQDQPQGYLIHLTNEWITRPNVARWFPWLRDTVVWNWRGKGLLPPANYQNRFEA